MEVSTTAVLIGAAILATIVVIADIRHLIGARRSKRRIQRRLDDIAKDRTPTEKRLDAILIGDTPHGPIGRVSGANYPLDGPQLIG